MGQNNKQTILVFGTCLFICQGTRPGNSKETYSVFESSCPPVTTSLTTQR